MGSMKYSTNDLVKYVQQYPAVIGKLMELHEAYDVEGTKKFFSGLDLSQPYNEISDHIGYKNNRDAIHRVVQAPDAYRLDPVALDQQYLSDEVTKQVYTSTVDQYENALLQNYPLPRKDMIALLNIQPGERVFEFGIGPGYTLEHYPDTCTVYGIDKNEASVEAARKRVADLGLTHVTAEVMDVRNMPLEDNQFDKALSMAALCVVAHPYQALQEVRRVLKPGGTIVLMEPCRSSIEEVAVLEYLLDPVIAEIGMIWVSGFPPYTVVFTAYMDVAGMLEEIGFRIDSQTKVDPFEYAQVLVATNTK